MIFVKENFGIVRTYLGMARGEPHSEREENMKRKAQRVIAVCMVVAYCLSVTKAVYGQTETEIPLAILQYCEFINQKDYGQLADLFGGHEHGLMEGFLNAEENREQLAGIYNINHVSLVSAAPIVISQMLMNWAVLLI